MAPSGGRNPSFASLRDLRRAHAPSSCASSCALLAAFGSLIAASSATAAKWEIVPSVSLEETYSDNITLAPRGLEQSDWVTTLTPHLTVHGVGDRARLDLDYSPQFLYYADENRTRSLQLYDARGTAELVRKTFFIDARSSETQQIVSLLGPQPADTNINLTQNRTAVRTNLISPYLLHDFGTQARADARVTVSKVEYDDPAVLSDSKSTNVDARLTSGPAYRLLTWETGYHRERVDYDQPGIQSVTFERVFVGLKRLVTAQTALTATLGYEDNNFLTSGPEPRGYYWTGGFEWNPSPRTRLIANGGHRFFGSTAFVDFSHRGRLTVWNFGYTKDITTSRSQFLIPAVADTSAYLNTLFTPAFPDPAARLAAVNAFIARNVLASSFDQPINFASTTPFLLKRIQASAGIQGVRNTILLSLYRDDREALAPEATLASGDFSLSGKTRQTGGSLTWTLALSPITSTSLGVGLTHDELPDGGVDERRKFIRAAATHQFTPRVSGSFIVRRQQNDTSALGADYRENSVSAIVTARF